MQIYEVHVQIVQRTKYIAKVGLHEVPENRNLKNILVFSALASRKQQRISVHLNGSNLTLGHSTITC